MLDVRMKTAGVLLVLSEVLSAALGLRVQRELKDDGMTSKPQDTFCSNPDALNTRGCANLTLVLDNWKFAIVTQVKDLLLHDHDTVLPDYGRIQLLSDALGDLYKELNSLKERLTALTAKFDDVETFVDALRSGRKRLPAPGASGSLHEDVSAKPGRGPAGRKSRVLLRKIIRPSQV